MNSMWVEHVLKTKWPSGLVVHWYFARTYILDTRYVGIRLTKLPSEYRSY